MSAVTRNRNRSRTRRTGTDVALAKEAAVEARIARELAKHDFNRRAVELRRLNKTYAEIAQIMSEERGEVITIENVRRHVLNTIRNVEAEADVRLAEYDKLESQRGKIRERIAEYEERDEFSFDVEEYQRLTESYLKYSDRIARLMGLDQGGNNGGAAAMRKQQEAAAAVAARSGGNHIHFHGSVDAFEEWQRLQDMGLTELARDVHALMSSDVPDEAITGVLDAPARTTLAPHIDTTATEVHHEPVGPASSLDALKLMQDGA